MTKAEKEKHQAELMKDLATLQDLEDEKRHRRRNTWIGGAAILVTALFSLVSCSVTNNEIRTMDNIAAQQQARERDQLRLRCGEQIAEASEPLLMLSLALSEAKSSASSAGASVEPAIMVGVMADFAQVAAVCSAAGLTQNVAKDRFLSALREILSASVMPLVDQSAATEELWGALDAYIKVDIIGMGAAFETETGSDDLTE
jgi:urease accessory protein UreF